MSYKPKVGAQMSTPNVIPMADIMLVLLIIFMVVTPMLQKGKQVDLAAVNNTHDMQAADKDDAIIVAGGEDVQGAALGHCHAQRRGDRFHHFRQRARDLAALERRIAPHAQSRQVSGIFLAQPCAIPLRDRASHPGSACLQQAGELCAASPLRVPSHGHRGPSPSAQPPIHAQRASAYPAGNRQFGCR